MAIITAKKEVLKPLSGAGFDLVLRPWPSAEALKAELTEPRQVPGWQRRKKDEVPPTLPPIAQLDEWAAKILLHTPMVENVVTKRLVIIAPVFLGFRRSWIEGRGNRKIPPKMPTRREIHGLLPKYGLRICHPQVAFELPFAQRTLPAGEKLLVVMEPIVAGLPGAIVFKREGLGTPLITADSGRLDLAIDQYQQLVCEIAD